MNEIRSEAELAGVAGALAGGLTGLTVREQRLVKKAGRVSGELVTACRKLIAAGDDPLGLAFCQLRTSVARREDGAVYTPAPIVAAMMRWAAVEGNPARIVDPGSGSGRFLVAAARQFPKAALVAVDTDPLALLMLRANAAVLGFSDRLSVNLIDYRRLTLPDIEGTTLFIGNPPYVRHHDISEQWKTWFADSAAALGFKASKLAGLHIHFFLKTRQLGRPGDYGAFITAAEWLDVNYGSILRQMLADGLGGSSLQVLAPEAMPFTDAITTGAITCFRIGRRPAALTIRAVDSIDQLDSLSGGKSIAWSRIAKASRWSTLIRNSPKSPKGYIELGEICRVHRGQVTGNNDVWIVGNYPGSLPIRVLVPTITRAQEIIKAGPVLRSPAGLQRVIDIPADLSDFTGDERKAINKFLAWARGRGAHLSYTALNRKCWWTVGLKAPAPIVCTYMARRPPAFARNDCRASLLNIGHGLYPRQPLSDEMLTSLVAWLGKHVRVDAGRTYAGGLTKFEPKEVERILIPQLQELHDLADQMDRSAASTGRGGREGSVPRRAA